MIVLDDNSGFTVLSTKAVFGGRVVIVIVAVVVVVLVAALLVLLDAGAMTFKNFPELGTFTSRVPLCVPRNRDLWKSESLKCLQGQ